MDRLISEQAVLENIDTWVKSSEPYDGNGWLIPRHLYDRIKAIPSADGDLISRKAVIKAVDKHTLDRSEIVLDEDITVILEEVPSVAIPSAEPKIVPIAKVTFDDDKLHEIVEEAVKNIEIEPKTEQFAKWVATEIFDDNWEYNKDAFAEIACRKLAKLGIVRAKGDEWELVEPQERSEE